MTPRINYYRDHPDEEEGVEYEDDQHGSLHLPSVDRFFLHKKTMVMVAIIIVTLLLLVKSKDQPEQGVGEGHPEAEDEEVLVLDRDKRQWELDLQEEVEPLEEHPVEAGQVEEVGEGEGGAEQG